MFISLRCHSRQIPHPPQDIFESPVFFEEGASAGDVRQGNSSDCWFLAALCALCNKPGLVDKICVAKDEKVGVYGFVFHRGAFKSLLSRGEEAKVSQTGNGFKP